MSNTELDLACAERRIHAAGQLQGGRVNAAFLAYATLIFILIPGDVLRLAPRFN